jgi:asparagine N-glycosylation enzyme membrane subunit Stt3
LEDLALIVTGIVFGVIFIGAVSVLLAVLARRNKISRYWPLGASVALSLLAVIAWQGSDRLGMITIGWALLTAVITLWPLSKK